MAWILTKYFITAAFIVAISEVARRSEKIGALLTALPLVALLTLLWLYIDGQRPEKIGSYATYTFWYVLPTLPMFVLFPSLLQRFGFWAALFIGILISGAGLLLLALVLRRFGISLL